MASNGRNRMQIMIRHKFLLKTNNLNNNKRSPSQRLKINFQGSLSYISLDFYFHAFNITNKQRKKKQGKNQTIFTK